MSFLNPIAVWIGALALGIPLAVHFLTRPRPKPLPLSTIQFVFEAIQQRRSRNRLRDLLVLLLRLLAIALLAAAIARPVLDRHVVVRPQDEGTEVARVIVVDVSMSMSAGRSGNQPLQRVQSVVDRYLDTNQGLTCAVIIGDARPRSVFEQFSVNLNVLRQSVRSLSTTTEQCDAMAAIGLASRFLTETDESVTRELVIVSDFQRSDWGAVRFDALPSDTKIQLESVALRESENVAIVGVNAPDRILPGSTFPLEIELANFGPLSRNAECRLSLGRIRQSVPVTIPAGESNVAFMIETDEPGWLDGRVELVGLVDDLQADDSRAIAIETAEAPAIVLLTRRDSRQKPSSSYYLSRALDQLGVVDDGLQILEPDRLTLETKADVLVVDHPGQMNSAEIKLLSRRLARGDGMIYWVAELADGVNLNALVNEFGAGLQLPVRFAAPKSRSRRDLSILEVNRREAPFDVFGDQLDLALAPIRIGGGLETRESEESLRDRVLARLSDRSAFLVAADAGVGKVLVINADLDRSNLAVRPAFLPLLAELISASLPRGAALNDSVCGRPMTRRLPSSVSIEDRIDVKPGAGWPERAEGYGNWEATATGMIWNWTDPSTKGVFCARLGDETIDAVAINSPASESDLTTLDSGILNTQGQGEQQLGFRNVRDDGVDEDPYWSWLLVACLLGMICEVCALRVSQT